jgi:hypothetical protein
MPIGHGVGLDVSREYVGPPQEAAVPGGRDRPRRRDRQHLEDLWAAGFVAVIVRSGGDIVSAHRSYDAAVAACPDPDPVEGIGYSAADLHEILYGEEAE